MYGAANIAPGIAVIVIRIFFHRPHRRWPSGICQTLHDVKGDREVCVEKPV